MTPHLIMVRLDRTIQKPIQRLENDFCLNPKPGVDHCQHAFTPELKNNSIPLAHWKKMVTDCK